MSHVRLAAMSAASAITAILGGCVEPRVDVVAAWVESVDDGSGRDVQIYDRGRRYAIRLEPEVSGSELERFGMAVDARGRGVALAGKRQTAFVGLGDTRQPVLSDQVLGGAPLSPLFAFTRSGDALLRAPDGTTAARYSFMPTSSSGAGVQTLLEPPDPLVTGAFELISASDAPVLYWVEHQDVPSRASGRITAFGYPSDVDPGGLQFAEITELGTGQLYAGPPDLVSDLQAPDTWCPHRTCVSPDGRGIIAPAPGRCRFWTWSWGDEPGPNGEIAPTEVVIQEGCPEDPRTLPSLFAAIDVDLAVLDDGDRVYLADLSAKTMRSAPKLWDNPGSIRLTAGGRAIVLVSDDSRVVRIGADGPRIISGDSLPCAGPPSNARISPNGLWVTRGCLGDGTFASSAQALIMRISPLGVETFVSVPMDVIGIDDGGNILMYSRSDTGEPRGLFVLEDDGGVTRIDALEPEPDLVPGVDGNEIYFSAGVVRP